MAKTLAQATKRPNNIGNAVPAPAVPVSPPPVATTIPRNLPGLSPSTHGPTPSVWTTQYDSVKQFYRPGTSQQRFPPLPTKANPQLNAASASVAKTIVATAIAAIPAAPPAAAPVTDGLIHGTTPWEIDPSSVIWNEDFTTERVASASSSPFLGTTNAWLFIPSAAVSGVAPYNLMPHIGVLQWYSNSLAANAVSVFTPTMAATSVFSVVQGGSLPLLDYPGWKATYVFMFSKSWALSGSGLTQAFSLAKTSTYIGFGSPVGIANAIQDYGGPRPNIFIGLRWDTDPGASAMPVTAVAAPSGGSSVYTGTFALGTNGYFVGNQITVTGCAASNNNGTFLCVGSTTATLSLVNAASTVASAQTGLAAQSGINDATMKFECVTNPFNSTTPAAFRNNTQGIVVDTLLVPTENVWYRLDMVCTAKGKVALTLSGGGNQFTSTITCPQVTLGTPSSATIDWFGVTNGWLEAFTSGSPSYDGVNMLTSPFAGGTIITVGNPPTGVIGPYVMYPATSANAFFWPLGNSITTGTRASTMTGYPGLWPVFMAGNDSSGGTYPAQGRAWNLDFFGLAYNPGLGGATVNTTYSRYFAGT